MDLLDLLKATLVCGLLAFFCYSFPAVGQALIIACLTFLWLGYACKVVRRLQKR